MGLADKLAGQATRLGAGPSGAPLPGGQAQGLVGRFLEIDPARIEANPDQPRQGFDQEALAALAGSIQEHGLLEPLLVRLVGARVVLVAGERRLRASRLAGLERVPCTVTEGDPAILALVENLHRRDLSPLEEAEGLAHLQKEKGLTLAQVAAVAGKAESTVSEILSLNKLQDYTKQRVRQHADKFPRRLLVELAKVEPWRADELAAQQVNEGGVTTAKVRAQRERKAAKQGKASKAKAPAPVDRAAHVEALFRRAEQLAGELLGINLYALDQRQRVLARHSLQPMARALDHHFHFLKKTAAQDDQRWDPQKRARLLGLIRGGMTKKQAREELGREINEDGRPLDKGELAAQLVLARQEALASAEAGEIRGDCED